MKNYMKKLSFVVIIPITFFAITLFFSTSGTTKVINNIAYTTGYTYYYPSDAYGSSNCTGSNKCIDDFTTDANGWYYYNYGGKDYLVVAAALKYCRDSNNHCGIDVDKHGIATKINYYDYYDTLELTISGKKYDAIVLDACGACMWGRQDTRGEELFDIFVENNTATAPTGGGSSNYVGNVGNEAEHFDTIYTGEITKGWLYERFHYQEIFDLSVPEFKIEKNINEVIDEIFDRAKTSYYSSHYESIAGLSGFYGNIDAGTYDGWCQYDSKWGSIHLGNSSYTMSSSGCAVTSVAIQMARSGVSALFDINPGSLVTFLNNNGGFSGASIYWAAASRAASGFQYNDSLSRIVGFGKKDASEKVSIIANYLSQGKYVIVHVGGSKNGNTTNHWVAVTAVSDGNVLMVDPSCRGTSLNDVYGTKFIDEIRVYEVG